MTTNAIDQGILRQLVSREVGECVSSLIWELSRAVESLPNWEEDLFALQSRTDWEGAARDSDEIEIVEIDGADWAIERKTRYVAMWNFPGCMPECEPSVFDEASDAWEWILEFNETIDWDEEDDSKVAAWKEWREAIAEMGGECGAISAPDGMVYSVDELPVGLEHYPEFVEEEGEEIDDWQELCESWGIEPYEHEAYEHWIVSGWLADRLEERGEIVCRDFMGLTIWGRCTTGQAILLDYVIHDIANEMEILSGQANDWARQEEERKLRIESPAILRDCLENCAVDNVRSDYLRGLGEANAYARGIVNGAVSAIMAITGREFSEALRVVRSHCRTDSGPHGAFSPMAIPEVWREDWEKLGE